MNETGGQGPPIQRRKKRLVIAVCIASFVALSVVGGIVIGRIIEFNNSFEDIPHKSDDQLMANFYAHKTEFEHLLQMVLSEKELYRVDDNWTAPDPPESVGVSKERIAEYRRIFFK